MCTTFDEIKTKKFWNVKHRKGKTWIWAYKFYDPSDGNIYSFYQSAVVNPGWNKSNRKSKEITDRELKNGIDEGVHVCLSTKELKYWLDDAKDEVTVVARVKCFKKDFIARDNYGCAVFMKYFLPKTEYDRTMKKIKNGS